MAFCVRASTVLTLCLQALLFLVGLQSADCAAPGASALAWLLHSSGTCQTLPQQFSLFYFSGMASSVPCVPTLYWPSPCDGEELNEGTIVGWANGDDSFVVACIASDERRVAALQMMRDLPSSAAYGDMCRDCAGFPCALGRWDRDRTFTGRSVTLLDVTVPVSSSPSSSEYVCDHAMLHVSLQAPGSGSAPAKASAATFMAAEDVALSHPDKGPACLLPHAQLVSQAAVKAPHNSTDSAESVHSMNVILFEPPTLLSLNSFSSRPIRVPGLHALGPTAVVRMSTDPPRSAFDCILSQLNAANFLAQLVLKRSPITAPGRAMTALAVPPPGAGSPASPVPAGSGSVSLLGMVLTPFLYLLLLFRGVAVGILYLIQWRIPPPVPIVGGAALYDLSSFARQLHLKLLEFCVWPRMLLRLRTLRHSVANLTHWHSPEEVFRETAQWRDYLFRTAFDIVVGVGACCLLAYAPWAVRLILASIHTVGENLHIDMLRTWIEWLMGLPAGLKLNHFAGKKIGGAVLSCISFWEYVTTFLTPFEPAIVVVVGMFGLGGFSLLLAVASDVLELATIHLFTLYAQFAWLHNRQMGLLGSLWKLFRGKKQNVLRSRVDSNDYDIAQLLLGTLFFTMVFFLFPTTLVYYVFFLVVWLGILSVRSVLWWLMTLMNNLPIYALYCAVAARHRIPGGVRLSLVATSTPVSAVEEATCAIMQRAKFGTVSATHDEDAAMPLASGAGTNSSNAGTLWFRLHSMPAGIAQAFTPFGDAMTVVTQRYSIGSLLRIALFGEQGLSLFRSVSSVPKQAVTGGPAGVAASGLAFGAHNAAANAPTEGPVPIARIDKHSISERVALYDSAFGTWQQYLSDLRSLYA